MKHEKLIAICEGALCVALAYALSLLELDLWYQGGSIGRWPFMPGGGARAGASWPVWPSA